MTKSWKCKSTCKCKNLKGEDTHTLVQRISLNQEREKERATNCEKRRTSYCLMTKRQCPQNVFQVRLWCTRYCSILTHLTNGSGVWYMTLMQQNKFTRLGMPPLQRILGELFTPIDYGQRVLLSSSWWHFNRANSFLMGSLLCNSGS